MKPNRSLFLKILLAGFLVLPGFTGCKKFVEVDPPKDRFPTSAVFTNDSLAQEAVTGLYIRIMSNNQFLLNGGLSVYAGLSADELTRTLFKPDDDQFAKNTLSVNNGTIANNFWKAAYAYIYQANACLENLSNSTKINTNLKNRLTGEAKFMRALCYWYLVNLFGDVPLATTSDADVNTFLARSPVTEVRQLILADLQDAWSLLPDTTVNTTPNKWAAAAFLARAYCYNQNWVQAEIFATRVIEAGKYSLVSLQGNVFSSASSEAIFQIAPVLPNNSTAEGFAFIPVQAGSMPVFALTDSLLNSFEPGDERKNNWIKRVTLGAQTYYYPYKYKINASSSAATEYNIVFRLGEQYLIRAEARAQQNKVAEAVDDINMIRGRASLPGLQANGTSAECLVAIEKERRVELFAEWGHRWLDLKRTSRIHAVLQPVKGNNWQLADQFYPIPFSEIQKDPNLVQNPGY